MSKQKEKQQLFALLSANRATVHLHVGLNDRAAYKVRVPEVAQAATGAHLLAPTANVAKLSDADPFANPADVQPQDSDFIYPVFRALSAALTRPSMEGLVIDFSTPGVLAAAAGKLAGQTVYKNHWHYDVEDFLGAVNQSVFDATGADVEGVPGINAELKIDKRIAPKIARGLLMTPPAINAVSVQVHFTFEYSHPRLVEENSFWRNLGQEIDGQIVRLIATEITAFGELSLVNRGADLYNRRLPNMPSVDDGVDAELPVEGDEVDAETGSKKKKKAGMSSQEPPKGERTMKLAEKVIAALGLQGDPATDFAESVVAAALPKLVEQAALSTQLLTGLREEVTAAALRVAALSHKGEEQPKLATLDAMLIGKADAAELATLKAHYEELAAASLTATCPKCHTQITSLRSSVDTTPQPAQTPRVLPVTTIH